MLDGQWAQFAVAERAADELAAGELRFEEVAALEGAADESGVLVARGVELHVAEGALLEGGPAGRGLGEVNVEEGDAGEGAVRQLLGVPVLAADRLSPAPRPGRGWPAR